jgi:GAF domain-containing protein
MNTVSFAVIWDQLTLPHPDLKEEVERFRARILAGLSLAMLLVVVLVTLMNISSPRGLASGLALGMIVGVAYWLSRTPWSRIGAMLLVAGEMLLNMALLNFGTSPAGTAGALAFTMLPVLLATVLLPATFTIIVGALTVVHVAIFSFTTSLLTAEQMIAPFIAIVLVSTIAGVSAYLRERDQETIFKQTRILLERSHSLEVEVDERTRYIAATADVGRAITGARDLDSLLSQVVNLIVERFKFYHAQVFLIDEHGKQAVLKASTGAAGQELLSRHHQLAVGSQSVIGQVTAHGDSVIAADTDVDAVHRRNELLPHTRSELALSLRAGGRIIGALDIQSVNPDAFDKEDIPVFQTMADQLAVAIENARLFQQAQHDLEDIENLNRQLTGEAWRRYLTGQSSQVPRGFEMTTDGIKPLSAMDVERQGEPVNGVHDSVSLPLKIRGETIGMLDLKPRSGQVPDSETLQMLEQVADRVAQALDSTRLGEQAQRQAAREQILSKLSAQLQATTDLNAILRIAATEAAQSLNTRRSFVRLVMEFGSEQDE